MRNTTPTYSPGVWIDNTSPLPGGWYRRINQTVQSANPLMQVMYSINVEGTTRNASFPTNEASLVIGYGNTTGIFNAFGSQGLAQADTSFDVTMCPDGTNPPDTGNNWACMFTKHWSGANCAEYNNCLGGGVVPTTVGLELQQIDCSNPCAVSGTCGAPGSPYTGSSGDECYLGPVPGRTGDLKTLFPWITQHHVSIIELYSQDAMLTFDPKFCDPDDINHNCKNTMGYDKFPNNLTSDSQYYFFTKVGQGTSCGGGSGAGDCSYAITAINPAHGPH